MEIQTTQIKTKNFKFKVTYINFKGRYFIINGGIREFKRSFRFWDLIGRDKPYLLDLFKKDNPLITEPTDFYREYIDFLKIFKPRKPQKYNSESQEKSILSNKRRGLKKSIKSRENKLLTIKEELKTLNRELNKIENLKNLKGGEER